MEERSRFICSDHSLCNMATAQEGAMKLLCVAARDGSISIINSRQCLLLRILSGHVKAALSLQVRKAYMIVILDQRNLRKSLMSEFLSLYLFVIKSSKHFI